MKIGMFTNTYLPHIGGVARSVHAFSHDLRRLGHDVLVVAPNFSGQMDETSDDVLRVRAIQNFSGSDFSVRLPQPLVVSRKIKSFAPDVIHSHHPFLMGDTAIRLARRKGLPLIFTHHTLYEQYTHYIPLDSPALKQFVVQLCTDYANLSTCVVAPSRSIADMLRRRGVAAPVEVIPTGVDMAFFAAGDGAAFRKAHGIPPRTLLIGHLGRLAQEKNLAFLAEAVADFLSETPRARFLVIGHGPAGEAIERVFREHAMTDRLVLAGDKSGTDVRDAYHAMDLFVFASKTETQGMVLLEAMACGLPVVALDASGSRDVVRDGSNGFLLPQDCPVHDFSRAISRLAAEPRRLEAFGRQAVVSAQIHSRQRCAARMVEVYRRARAAHCRQPPMLQEDFSLAWERLFERLKIEWQLLSKRTIAAAEAVGAEPNPERFEMLGNGLRHDQNLDNVPKVGK